MCVSYRLRWLKSILSAFFFLVCCLLDIDVSSDAGNQVLKMKWSQKWKEMGHLGHCVEESCPVENTYNGTGM